MFGKVIRRKKRQDEEITYWLSFSDLMSSLLIVFVLLFIYVVLDYNQALATKEAKIKELSSVRSKIITKLVKELGNDIAIDKNTGAIKLKSEVLFDKDKSELKPEGQKFLSEFVPKYLKVLLGDPEIKGSISTVIIEGHTDDDGTYIYNLELSQSRALSVVKYISQDPINIKHQKDIEKYFSAIGRSKSDLIEKDGKVLQADSRRVEFKFRLKDEETLKSILNEIDEEK